LIAVGESGVPRRITSSPNAAGTDSQSPRGADAKQTAGRSAMGG
jgi:hypothetical protein